MRLARALAVAALLASPAALARLCDGPCSIVIDFANGGLITTSDGAELTFGAGGSLVLGTGGSLVLGAGGVLTPDVDPPDMSAGGTLVLGAGGSINFGTGGSLDSGASGGIAPLEGSNLAVVDALSVTVDSTQSIHLGAVSADGTATLTAGGDIVVASPTSPVHIDATGSIAVTSDADVTYGTVTAASVVLNDAANPPGGGEGNVFCTDDCPSGGSSSIGSPTIPTESGTFTSTNTGAFGLLQLLPLVLLGLRRRFIALGRALALLLAAPAAMAASMCDGPCSVAISFPGGGSIITSQGATFSFGPDGGLVDLGEGGSMDLGEGGSFGTLEGGPPNMSQGGELYLGPGGSLTFGVGGELRTGVRGGVTVAEGGALEVAGAKSVAIDSARAVHLGDLASHGRVEMTGGGDFNGCDAGNPIPISMIVDDAETTLSVTAAGDISMGSFKGHPDVYITLTNGDATICVAEGTYGAGEGSGGTGTGGSEAGAGIILDGGSGSASCLGCDDNLTVQNVNAPVIDGETAFPDFGGAGAIDPLLLLGLVWLGRRRR